MAFESMHILLKTQLHGCQIKGTSVRESGLTVSTGILAGEIILFFQTDSNQGRRCLNMKGENVRCSDYLVFYANDKSVKEKVCFLELKGQRFQHAVDQVTNAYNHLTALSKDGLDKCQRQNVVWSVSICMHGQAPVDEQKGREQLIKIFGKENIRIKHGVKQDKLLGDFLRKLGQ